MDDNAWEDLREEVCTYLAVGYESGTPELDTVALLVWREREKCANLYVALGLIDKALRLALDSNVRAHEKASNLLEWKAASRTSDG